MTVAVTPLTHEEREAVRALAVAPEQADFVATNAESIEEADERPECVPLAVHADGKLVGFAMYALDPDDGNYWIYRLMIDRRFQGRGYGRAALLRVVELIAAQPGCTLIVLGVQPGNTHARRLYASAGFHETGEMIGGEVVMRYDLACCAAAG
ncbi:GNAT family N-acetyltransferase [Chelatococcus sp. SYSU_G07232]|uniref:GNAT family N-acetyltransferase n=1 Tax=Chelatococcus albus TaxID=3047466 RepID=A0ABT7AJG3_9HYPH|nr:GNAT family N-acetyltransferase [Chelatococcus sp. SYSU_G07232]MDJ1159522.1 GNAT family N-acetyltransferase [Chelatococcus sp. SYSU_G07232]